MREHPTVLVVDGDADVRRLCDALLTPEGCRVLVAEDGATGLAHSRAQRPGLVLVGVATTADGWWLVEALAADSSLGSVPVVVLADVLDEATLARGWALGVAEQLAAPLTPGTLAAVLHDVLATSPDDATHRRERILRALRLE